VHLASAGIQGLRKPADTTFDVLPSESEDSGEVDDEDGDGGTGRKKKRRGGGPPPDPASHLRVWMPACMVGYVLPDLVDGYEAALEAKRVKKSKPKVPRGTTKASKGKGKPALASRQTVQTPSQPTHEEYFDLDVSSSGESDGRESPLPSVNHSRPLPTTSSRDTLLPQLHTKKPNDAVVRAVDDVFADHGMLPPTGVVRRHTHLTQDSPQRVMDTISVDDGAPEPSKTRTHHHLTSPSKVLQKLDQNLITLNMFANLPSKAQAPPAPLPPSSSSTLSPRLAPRPFPIAFEAAEEEELSSDDGRDVPGKLFTSSDLMQHAPAPSTPPPLPWPVRPLPVVGQSACREEEGEESNDDPDSVPAELPVFCPFSSPQGQSRTSGDPRQQQQQQPQPSSSSSPSSKEEVQSPAREGEDNDFPIPLSPSPDHRRRRRRRRVSERSSSSSSIISISTDNEADDGINSLQTLTTKAPLLIARSRSRGAVSRRLAAAAAISGVSHYRQQNNFEHEVIDLT
jgi:hypothetical protein